VTIATAIVCVDCGGRAHLVQPLDPDNLPEPGDILTYRCEDCADRWDLVVDEADLLDD
jgi:predicted nucleic acid-binding Zn ribbon protein